MRKVFMLLAVLVLAAISASAWPPAPLPQCDFVNCADGCTVPINSKCALVASDAVAGGDQVACVVGASIGTCYP